MNPITVRSGSYKWTYGTWHAAQELVVRLTRQHKPVNWCQYNPMTGDYLRGTYTPRPGA